MTRWKSISKEKAHRPIAILCCKETIESESFLDKGALLPPRNPPPQHVTCDEGEHHASNPAVKFDGTLEADAKEATPHGIAGHREQQ